MPYTKEVPQWNAAGTKPPQSLIDTGWQFNQKPPADYFNWQWNSVYQVLNELHQYALHSEKLGAANGVATLGADSKLTPSQLPAISSAQITDGSITNNDLATDVKVGSLAALGTTAKSNVVAAVNEVRTNLNTHTGDASIHVTTADKTAWNAKAETTVASTSANGLMSSADKTKLDGVAANANNYTHPATHPASIIVQDASNRFVSDAEKSAWNAKASTAVATTSTNGLMSSGDKTKLDGIATNANNYSHPTGDGNLHVPATGTTNSGKYLRSGATAGSAAWATIDWSEIGGKPSTFDPSAHSHPISEVTGLQTALDGKSATSHTHPNATTSVSGFMAVADKSKLDGISANANRVTNPSTNGVIAIDGVNTTVYAHPTGDGNLHVPATSTTNNGKFLKAGSTAGSLSWQTILAGDVSGLQALLDDKSDVGHGHAVATTSANGFMASTDKSKLDGIAAGAQTNQNAFSNVKVGATTIAADSATDTLELIAGTNIGLSPNATSDSVTISNTTPAATTSVAGLMSAGDKSKLDGVATGANNYVHPSTHPATMITEDASNRFVTDTQIATWNAKASTAVATTAANGLMAAADKLKLDGISSALSGGPTSKDLAMDNGNFMGINGLWFNDSMDAAGEGMLFPAAGKIGSINQDDYYGFGISGTGYLTFKNGGRPLVSAGQILWTGGAYPGNNTTITPSAPLSDCPNGWILVWSDYDVGVGTNDYDFIQSFIHKSHTLYPGAAMYFPTPHFKGDTAVRAKYLTINNGTIVTGADDKNADSPLNDVALRYVIAW